MSATALTDGRPAAPLGPELLALIAAGAQRRDATAGFPDDAFRALADAGALALTVPPRPRAQEWPAVRAVAAADASVGRLYEGHLNGVERIAVTAPEPLRAAELAAVAAGERRLGVWGADPGPGEGEPARLVPAAGGWALEGVKIFCSGAGGLDRALVTARHPEGGAPRLAYVELAGDCEVDPTWFRAGGMRASESHRVVFHGARVVALLGGPGELVREPWFSRDALRTAAAWAGIADTAADAALADLGARPELDDLRAHAAGRIVTARATIDRWLAHAAERADADPQAPLSELAVLARVAIVDAGNAILSEAGRACGSRPFATGTALDRARRDFELFALQHRLDPMLARVGRAAAEAAR